MKTDRTRLTRDSQRTWRTACDTGAQSTDSQIPWAPGAEPRLIERRSVPKSWQEKYGRLKRSQEVDVGVSSAARQETGYVEVFYCGGSDWRV